MTQAAARFWSATALLGVALMLGASVVVSPWLPVGGAAALLAVWTGLRYADSLPQRFLSALGILLAGYLFMGRGFAYVGVPPVFIGEIVLMIGVLAVLVCGRMMPVLSAPMFWPLIGFMVWGAIRTMPFVTMYGADAFRDAAIWAYAAFALLVARFLPEGEGLHGVLKRYRKALPWFLVFTPVAAALNLYVPEALPYLGRSDATLPSFKPGDVAVHLAGCAAFMVLGLPHVGQKAGQRVRMMDSILWALWLCCLVVVAALNRGGALAIFVALLVALMLRPIQAGKRLAHVGVLAALVVIALFVFDVSIERQNQRPISARQITANVGSVLGENDPDPTLADTRTWRLQWWQMITDYTVHGQYFWTGKGFGVNIAEEDGFGLVDHSLRSPHNVQMTILARGGVPGLSLWGLMLCTFGGLFVVGYIRARRAHDELCALMLAWILAYGMAFLVDGTFDVFLEAPQGGIWFWSLVGIGCAALRSRGWGMEVWRDLGAREPAGRGITGS